MGSISVVDSLIDGTLDEQRVHHPHQSLPKHYSHRVVTNGTVTRVTGTYFQGMQVDESDSRGRGSRGAHLVGFLRRMHAGITTSELTEGARKVHLKVCLCVNARPCVLSVCLSNRVTPQRAVKREDKRAESTNHKENDATVDLRKLQFSCIWRHAEDGGFDLWGRKIG